MDSVMDAERYPGTGQDDQQSDLCPCKIENRKKSPLKDTSNRDKRPPSSSKKARTSPETPGKSSHPLLGWVTCSCGERYLAQDPNTAVPRKQSRPSVGKRRRVIMDFVELQSVEQIKREIKLEADLKALLHLNVKKEEEEDIKAPPSLTIKGKAKKPEGGDNKKLKKSKKEKNEGFRLNSDSLHKRLLPIGLDVFPIPVPRDISDLLMHRYFISNTYGGSPMVTEPKPGFTCIALTFHPNAPAIPGAPGLYLSPGDLRRDAERWCKTRGEFKLIVKIRESVGWQYMGQYRYKASWWMTKEEWREGSQRCRDIWVKEVHTTRWGRTQRIRVHLWKTTGHRPTQAQINHLFKKDEKDYKDLVTTKDIEDAFWEGVIPIGVYTLKCIGYDEEFARKNAREHPIWLEKRKKEAKATKAKAKDSGPGSALGGVKSESVSVSLKRERPDHSDSDDDSDQELEKPVKRRRRKTFGDNDRGDGDGVDLVEREVKKSRSLSPEV